MTAITEVYASKLCVADYLGKLRARAVTITAVARTRPTDSAAAYARHNGLRSPPGQTPKDHRWFLREPQNRRHAALLLLLYAKYRAVFEPQADSHGLAFSIAYATYLRVTGKDSDSALVSIERFNLLVGTGFGYGWRGIPNGSSSKFAEDNVKILNCTKCKLPHLVEAHRLNYECKSH